MDAKGKFASRLRKLRISKNVSQAVVGEVIGVKTPTICSYEKGNSEPALEKVVKLADFFNVSLDFLLCRDEVQTLTKDQIPKELRALGIDEIKINQLSSNDLQKELTELAKYAEKIKKILKDLGK